MKLLPALTATVCLASLISCASPGPPLPPSLELPHPPSDLRATRKGDKVTLTWTVPARTMQRQTVRYLGDTRICRSIDPVVANCDKPAGKVPAPNFTNRKIGEKLTASYIDILPPDLQRHDFSGSAAYAVEVFNRDGRTAGLSNQVHVPLAEAWPAPKDFSAKVIAQGVELTWTGTPLSSPTESRISISYRVYRRLDGTQQVVLVGEKPAGPEIQMSLIDQNFDWEKTYYYHADSLTLIAQPGKPETRIVGDDTPEVKVFAHDIFPPAVPSGLQAVFSGPGQQAFIDLIWAPVADADLAGYNIYRHEDGSATIKLNSELVKTPAFRDTQVLSGKTYFYAVSAVDQRGNESAKSQESSETTP